jgi:hypothetical protein
MSTTVSPSIADVVSGQVPDGQTVTLSGIANSFDTKTTLQGSPWLEFLLIETGVTAVTVALPARAYALHGEELLKVRRMVNSAGRPCTAPYVTVHGRVDRDRLIPAVVADQMIRHATYPTTGGAA